MTTDAELATIAQSLRRRCIEMCRGRGRGYAGQGLALADIMAVLYFDALRRDGNTLTDRVVLSTGHSAIAVYSALGELGVFTEEELRTYGQDGSRIEESPLSGLPGFPITGGSLGQGLSQAVGLTLGDRMAGRDTRTFCIVSDGELQEGQTWEAAMSAAHYRLNNLVVLIDNNRMQADGDPAMVMAVEPIDAKFAAFGFDVERVTANDLTAVRAAIHRAMRATDRPVALVCDTVLGFGVPSFVSYAKVHYMNVSDDVWLRALEEIG